MPRHARPATKHDIFIPTSEVLSRPSAPLLSCEEFSTHASCQLLSPLDGTSVPQNTLSCPQNKCTEEKEHVTYILICVHITF